MSGRRSTRGSSRVPTCSRASHRHVRFADQLAGVGNVVLIALIGGIGSRDALEERKRFEMGADGLGLAMHVPEDDASKVELEPLQPPRLRIARIGRGHRGSNRLRTARAFQSLLEVAKTQVGAAHLEVAHRDLVADRHVHRVRQAQRLVQPKRLLRQSQAFLVVALGRTQDPQGLVAARERVPRVDVRNVHCKSLENGDRLLQAVVGAFTVVELSQSPGESVMTEGEVSLRVAITRHGRGQFLGD